MLPATVFGELSELSDILTQGYAQAGEDALLNIIVYLVICAFSVPSVIYCVREIQRMEVPERGAFLVARQTTRPPAPAGVGHI